MKYKIGQHIEFTAPSKIKLAKGGTAQLVKGDKAMVVRKVDNTTGEIVYITGQAKGLSQIISIEVDDNIDTDALTERILKELQS